MVGYWRNESGTAPVPPQRVHSVAHEAFRPVRMIRSVVSTIGPMARVPVLREFYLEIGR